jgi:hypothetical protein
MRKGAKFIVLFIILAVLLLAVAARAEDMALGDIDNINTQIKDVNAKIQDFGDKEKRAFLVQQYRKIIFDNKITGPINKFLENNAQSIVLFKILFGEPYKLTPSFYFVLFLWIFTAFWIKKVVKGKNPKSPFRFLGFLLAVILAQVNVYRNLTNLIFNFILGKESWWAQMLIEFGILAVIILMYYFGEIIASYLKAKKEAAEKKLTEIAQKRTQRFAQVITTGREKALTWKEKIIELAKKLFRFNKE